MGYIVVIIQIFYDWLPGQGDHLEHLTALASIVAANGVARISVN